MCTQRPSDLVGVDVIVWKGGVDARRLAGRRRPTDACSIDPIAVLTATWERYAATRMEYYLRVLNVLQLRNFKNFTNATLKFGRFTALIGANASGKSNIRDALRFLHGVSRGYTLAEIIGEKWIEGGVLQWAGVRGGSRQIARNGTNCFSLRLNFEYFDGNRLRRVTYLISVHLAEPDYVPRLRSERLTILGRESYVFDTHPDNQALGSPDPLHILARVRKIGPGAPRQVPFLSSQPILSQLPNHPSVPDWAARNATAAMQALGSMRFLDLSPDAARQPSQAGVTTLGDRGENLSSVLQAIATDKSMRHELADWVTQLTPMDARDFVFKSDPSGRVLAVLVEDDGRETPLTTASDGTVRFLATIAALMGPGRATFAFFEELENGIHPNRLHLLLELIDRSVSEKRTQVVATTHSPYLLLQLSEAQRRYASLTFRAKDGGSGIIPVTDLPEARRILAQHDIAQLMAAGWFEDTVDFSDIKSGASDAGPGAA
jgi:predicted ATPase